MFIKTRLTALLRLFTFNGYKNFTYIKIQNSYLSQLYSMQASNIEELVNLVETNKYLADNGY